MKAKVTLLAALATLSLVACGGTSSSSQPSSDPTPSSQPSEPASEPSSSSQAPTSDKSFTLKEDHKFVDGEKTLDLKPFIELGDKTTIADLQFEAVSDDIKFEDGVMTATTFGFHNIEISIKGVDALPKSFSVIMGPKDFLKATYKGKTPSGRDDSLAYTYEDAAEVTLTFKDEKTFHLVSTAGKGLKSGEQVDVPAAEFDGNLTISSGLFLLTNNEAGWSELKGNFMDSAENGFMFKIGGLPNGAASANLKILAR